MSKEIEALVANTKDREALAVIFDRIAELCREPIEFTRDDAPTVEEVVDGIDKGGARVE